MRPDRFLQWQWPFQLSWQMGISFPSRNFKIFLQYGKFFQLSFLLLWPSWHVTYLPAKENEFLCAFLFFLWFLLSQQLIFQNHDGSLHFRLSFSVLLLLLPTFGIGSWLSSTTLAILATVAHHFEINQVLHLKFTRPKVMPVSFTRIQMMIPSVRLINFIIFTTDFTPAIRFPDFSIVMIL